MKLREFFSIFLVAGAIIAACFGVDLFTGNLSNGDCPTPSGNTSYFMSK